MVEQGTPISFEEEFITIRLSLVGLTILQIDVKVYSELVSKDDRNTYQEATREVGRLERINIAAEMIARQHVKVAIRHHGEKRATTDKDIHTVHALAQLTTPFPTDPKTAEDERPTRPAPPTYPPKTFSEVEVIPLERRKAPPLDTSYSLIVRKKPYDKGA